MSRSPETVIPNDGELYEVETDVYEVQVVMYGEIRFISLLNSLDPINEEDAKRTRRVKRTSRIILRRDPNRIQIGVTRDLRLRLPGEYYTDQLTHEAIRDIMKEIGCTIEYVEPSNKPIIIDNLR